MKKLLTLILVALFSCYTFAQSENTDNTQKKKTEKKSYQFYKNYSHWSLAVSGGFDFLMSERDQRVGEEIKNFKKDNFLGEFNFEAEYSVNPIWGVAINYAYAPFNKRCIFLYDMPMNVNPEKHGQAHQIYFNVNVNLLNLFSRYRAHTEWGWYGGVGIGLVTYNTSKKYITTGEEIWSVVPMIPVQSSIEYSPISSLSIFVKAALGFYLRDNINVCNDGAMNDWNLYGGLGIRWNINADKKPHVRVTDVATYQKDANNNGNGTDTAAQNRIKKLEQQIKDLQNQMNQGKKCCDEVQAVKKHADDNTDEINRLRTKLDSVKVQSNINTEISDNSVYFAHNKWEIEYQYQTVIEKIARIMLSYPELELDIESFCSKVGNVEKNKIVGDNRIEAVKAILVNKYNISPSRIHSLYNGQVFEGLESENRRCDLKLR